MNNKTVKLFELLEIIEKLIEKSRHLSSKDMKFDICVDNDPYLSIQFNTPLFHEIIIRIKEDDRYEYFTFFANSRFWFQVQTNHLKVIEIIFKYLLKVVEFQKILNA